MRIILIYDINVERVTKVMKLCRQYLEHIQNSVFEGDITDADLRELKSKLSKIINNFIKSVIIIIINKNEKLWIRRNIKMALKDWEKIKESLAADYLQKAGILFLKVKMLL